MRKALLLLMLLGLPAAASAMWAYIPLEDLVPASDIIIVGTLRDVKEHTAGETDYGQGRIEVREVIWGNVSPGDSLQLKWSNASAIACPRVEHKHNADKEGIWLLTRDGKIVRADYPGRFVNMSERRKVEAALDRLPVVLRAASYWVAPGDPLSFAVVYRNTSNHPRSFPGLTFDGGELSLTPGSQLEVTVMDEEVSARVKFVKGAVRQSQSLPAIIVEPRNEHRVEVVLNDMLKAEPKVGDYYTVRLKLAGREATNDVQFYIGKTDFPKPEAAVEAESPASTAPSSVYVFKEPRRGLSPLVRAELTALAALVFFPLFYRLRINLADARLARVLLADRDAVR